MNRGLLIICAVLVALFLAAPASAQNISFVNDVTCTPQGGSFQSAPGTGCLAIEASTAAFTKLRDALTPNWDGNLTCNSCTVASGFPGCVAVGDVVATTRKKAALAQLSCVLRSAVVQKDIAEGRASSDAGVDRDPVIGGGDPQ